MSIVAGRTRAQIRQAIGYLLPQKLFRIRTSTGAGAADGTTIVDTGLPAGDDNQNGKWAVIASGTSPAPGEIAQVSDSTGATSITLEGAGFSAQVGGSVSYEVWDEHFPPARIHSLLDSAILSLWGRFYDEEESVALCGDGEIARFDLPSEFAMLKSVWHRYKVEDKTVHEGTAAYDESVDADFTVTVDSENKLGGKSSIKFVVAGTAGNGDIASDSISSLDLSGYTHIEFWIEVVTAVAANDLRFRLSSTVNGGTETESLNIPALTALTKTKVRIALANPQSDSAIISVALEYNANVAANTIWISQVKAVRDDTALWEEVPRHLWRIDHEARDLILARPAVTLISDHLLKLVGGDNPVLLTADTTASEVPESWLIPHVAALFLATASQADLRALGLVLGRQADVAMNRFPSLDNVRVVKGS